MSVRLFCNIVYAWLKGGAAGDPEARDKIDAHLYAPAIGLDAANAKFWAAIQSAPED